MPYDMVERQMSASGEEVVPRRLVHAAGHRLATCGGNHWLSHRLAPSATLRRRQSVASSTAPQGSGHSEDQRKRGGVAALSVTRESRLGDVASASNRPDLDKAPAQAGQQ
jgi:hypothetical protein